MDSFMKLQLYGLTLLFGVVLTVHLAMNGAVGAALANPRVGNALFWCIGAAAAVVIGATGWQSGALAGLRGVNPVLLTAGAIGACLVFGIAWLIPQIGASSVMIGLIAGQVLGGMVLSHYGWLGSPVQPVSASNLLGALVMLAGVWLATKR
jgi:transporter family-2 protein